MAGGRLFQTRGPATANALSPMAIPCQPSGNPIYISYPSRLTHQGKSQLQIQEHIYFVIATHEVILPSYNTPPELSEYGHCYRDLLSVYRAIGTISQAT